MKITDYIIDIKDTSLADRLRLRQVLIDNDQTWDGRNDSYANKDKYFLDLECTKDQTIFYCSTVQESLWSFDFINHRKPNILLEDFIQKFKRSDSLRGLAFYKKSKTNWLQDDFKKLVDFVKDNGVGTAPEVTTNKYFYDNGQPIAYYYAWPMQNPKNCLQVAFEDVFPEAEEEPKQEEAKVHKHPNRNEDYYEFFDKLFKAGIELEYLEATGTWYPVNDYKPNAVVQYRVKGTPDDCPDVNTQEYWDYWMNVGVENLQALNGKLWTECSYASGSWDAWNGCKPVVFRHKPEESLKANEYGADSVIDTGPNTIKIPKSYPVFDSVSFLEDSIQVVGADCPQPGIYDANINLNQNKETNMNELNLEVKVNGKDVLKDKVAKVKTALQLTKKQKVYAEFFNQSGGRVHSGTFKNEDAATQLLATREYIGCTVVVYKQAAIKRQKLQLENA